MVTKAKNDGLFPRSSSMCEAFFDEFADEPKNGMERRSGRSAGADPADMPMPVSTIDQITISETRSVGLH